MLPLWVEPTRAHPFQHHDIWPGARSYGSAVSWPAWTLIDRAPECVFAYVQVRALVGGTTSIQGWPSASRPPSNRLVRSIDNDRLGARSDPVLVSALTLDLDGLRDKAAANGPGTLFVYHCAEGAPASKVAQEFEDALTAGCLNEGFVAIHACALDSSHFGRWRSSVGARRASTGAVVWSPFSNLWLYGVTTDVPAARAARLQVCLGTDWGPSGTKNLLGELKVARQWSDRAGWSLSDHDLVRMVTATPGDLLARAWDVPVGRLVPGGVADLTVVRNRRDDPWRSLVAATERDIQLVVVGGQARLGTKALMEASGVRATTAVPVGSGETRRVHLVRPDDPERAWTWTDVVKRLDAVRADAAVVPPSGPAAGRRGPGSRPARPPRGDPPGAPPLEVSLDMPGGGSTPTGGPPPKGRTVDIPPLEPLHHDQRWFTTIPGRGFHTGVLDGLRRAFQEPR
jgi:hypothetical protein